MPKENILTVPCDVLIPAAIGGVIHEGNANDLQCKVGRGGGRQAGLGGWLAGRAGLGWAGVPLCGFTSPWCCQG